MKRYSSNEVECATKKLKSVTNTLTLSFVPNLLVPYLRNIKAIIHTSKECYQVYYRFFVQKSKCRANAHIVPRKALKYIRSLFLDVQSKHFDLCPLTNLESNRNKFVPKLYCSSLTSLKLLMPMTDYSGLQHCTRLTKCKLILGTKYDHLQLPLSLRKLKVTGGLRSKPLTTFPSQLTHLHWNMDEARVPLDKLPSTLTSLTSKNMAWNVKLPASLLIFKDMGLISEGTLLQLPHGLMELDFRYYCRAQHVFIVNFFTTLPATLTKLDIEGSFHPLPIVLPPNVIELTFGDIFNEFISSYPPNLTKLRFGNKFSQKIDHLPHSLMELTLGHLFHHPLDHLPNQLQVFIATCESYFLPLKQLPNSITYMKLTTSMLNEVCVWPSHLIRLDLQQVDGDQIDLQTTHNVPPNTNVIVSHCGRFKHSGRMRCTNCLDQEHDCFYFNRKWVLEHK